MLIGLVGHDKLEDGKKRWKRKTVYHINHCTFTFWCDGNWLNEYFAQPVWLILRRRVQRQSTTYINCFPINFCLLLTIIEFLQVLMSDKWLCTYFDHCGCLSSRSLTPPPPPTGRLLVSVHGVPCREILPSANFMKILPQSPNTRNISIGTI